MSPSSLLSLARAFNKIGQRFAEKIVTGNDEQITRCSILSRDDEIDITDGAEFIGIAPSFRH